MLITKHAVAKLIETLRYQPEDRGFDSRRVIGIFHWHIPSGQNYGPAVDSVSNKNEYLKYKLEE